MIKWVPCGPRGTTGGPQPCGGWLTWFVSLSFPKNGPASHYSPYQKTQSLCNLSPSKGHFLGRYTCFVNWGSPPFFPASFGPYKVKPASRHSPAQQQPPWWWWRGSSWLFDMSHISLSNKLRSFKPKAKMIVLRLGRSYHHSCRQNALASFLKHFPTGCGWRRLGLNFRLGLSQGGTLYVARRPRI